MIVARRKRSRGRESRAQAWKRRRSHESPSETCNRYNREKALDYGTAMAFGGISMKFGMITERHVGVAI